MTRDIAIEDRGSMLEEDGFDALEDGLRQRIRSFIEELLEAEREVARSTDAVMMAVRGRRDTGTATVTASFSARSGR
jgi:hypothetical protein